MFIKKESLLLRLIGIIIYFLSFMVLNIWCVDASMRGNPEVANYLKFIVKFIFLYAFGAFFILALFQKFPKISVFILILNAFLSFFILDWHAYLGDVPTVKAVTSAFANNLTTAISLFDYIHFRILFLCVLTLLLQILGLFLSSPLTARIRRSFFICGLGGVCLFLFSYAIVHHTAPWEFGSWSLQESIERRSYLVTWLSEICDRQDYRVEKTCSDQRVVSLPLFSVEDKFVIIQVECLDWAALEWKVKGEPLMPTLDRMAASGLLFKVDGAKKLISANSDYELLNTRVANAMELFYDFIPTYPDSFANFFTKRGVPTTSWYGFSGNFCNRNAAFQKMGIKGNHFFEELTKEGLKPLPQWGDRIDDRDVFSFARDNLLTNASFFSVLITMNLHDNKKVHIPADLAGEQYASSLALFRETDEALKILVDALPEGTTVLVIGDHSSYHGPRSNFVPCVLYEKGINLSSFKKDIPEGTIWSRCEISQYVRRLFGMPSVAENIPLSASDN